MGAQITKKRQPGLEDAIQAAGGVTALAGLLEITYQAIQKWSRIPPKRVIPIETMTGIAREELRPDLYPPRRGRAV